MSALKKPHCDDCEPKAKAKTPVKKIDTTDSVTQKAEIDRMKRLITEKIKDPNLARKAALIISEMLDKKIK